MGDYLNQPMAELAKELAAGLLRLRKGYVDAAEAFLRILEPSLEYPYELVVYRLTGYRPRCLPVNLSGQSLRHDLAQLILHLCDSFDLPADAYGEPAYELPALAEQFKVSTKTVQRWRSRGLVARKLVFEPGKKRLAFLKSSLDAFAEKEQLNLSRATQFSQLSEQERQEIIDRARRIVQRTDCCLNEVSKHLAKRTGRAVETIRYSIRNHDRDNPRQAVLPAPPPPIDEVAREAIYRCFLQGVSVPTLALRYARTRGSMYRVINEERARQLQLRSIEYVYNPLFDLPGCEDTILGEIPASPADAVAQPRAPEDLPPYLKSLYGHPLLSPAQEQALFRRLNYLKFKADQLRKRLDPARVQAGVLRQIERMLIQADAVKNQIVRANLRLVVSIAKRHVARATQDLFELISDGNVTLLKAVEKFDYSRGFKFSTYASWATIKNFARTVPRERYLLDKFVTGHEQIIDLVGVSEKYDPKAAPPSDLRDSLQVVLAQLSPRERGIIVGHFGLNDEQRPATLEDLSHSMGISKERVRQIEHRAMEKLREMLGPVQADLW